VTIGDGIFVAGWIISFAIAAPQSEPAAAGIVIIGLFVAFYRMTR
jgi:hypothetical protein